MCRSKRAVISRGERVGGKRDQDERREINSGVLLHNRISANNNSPQEAEKVSNDVTTSNI